MSLSSMPEPPRFQYSLRSLLWLMTGVAVLCSLVATWPKEYRGLLIELAECVATIGLVIVGAFFGAAAAIDIASWFKTPDAVSNTLGKKIRLLRQSGGFWIAVCVAFPIAILLNFVPYYFSYRADEGDGVERMGWPLTFYACGGIEGFVYRSTLVFCVDMLIAAVSAVVVGVAFRNGVAPIYLHARQLLHRIRTWPNEEECPRKPEENGKARS